MRALGQTVAEELVRLGANQIALFDEDEMTLHNCNRQIYANQTTLGQKKVQVAVQQLKRINPYGNYVGFEQMITVENGYDWLKDRDVIFDCVDDPKTKIELEELAKQLDIPLVHGAVNQWYGQVALVLPNDNLLKEIYKNCKKEESNTNVMTVNMIASMQVAELCKWLELKCGNKQLRMLDVRKMELSTVSIK